MLQHSSMTPPSAGQQLPPRRSLAHAAFDEHVGPAVAGRISSSAASARISAIATNESRRVGDKTRLLSGEILAR